MAGLKLRSNVTPRVTDARWDFSEEQKQAAEAAEAARIAEETPTLNTAEIEPSTAPSVMSTANGAVNSAGSFMSQPGVAAGIGAAGTAVGQAADPQGVGGGPALSGAAQGAAIGTTIAPGYGTVIGAAIGLGMGLMQADNKRKQVKRQTEANILDAQGKGLENAAQASKNIRFSFGTRDGSFSGKRGLKL